MNILYKPKGPAKEYADDPIDKTEGWAANLYIGCLHGCQYCYVPTTPYWTFKYRKEIRRAEFHSGQRIRNDVLHKLLLDCKRCQDMEEPTFLSFTSDIWQVDSHNSVTRPALLLFEDYGITVTALTKGGMQAVPDFDIFERNPEWKFGTTLIFSKVTSREKWEPRAASILSRMNAIRIAKMKGIYTWVSMEPVLYPEEALEIIRELMPYVDFWKVGKLNHGKSLSEELGEIEARVDWGKFLADVESVIPKENLLIKHDLEVHRGK